MKRLFFIPVLLVSLNPASFSADKGTLTPESLLLHLQPVVDEMQAAFPNEAVTCFLTGFVLHSAGRFEAAVEQYRKGVAIEGQNPAVEESIASVFYDMRRYEDAVRYYQRVRQEKALLAGSLLRLGESLLQLNRTSEAQGVFEETVRQYPTFAAAHFHLAQIRFDAGDFRTAMDYVKTAMELAPEVADSYYLTAQIHRAMGEKSEAEAMLSRFQEIKVQSRSFFEQVEGAAGQRKAETVAAKAHVMAGELYFQNQAYEKAIRHFETAASIDGKQVEARVHLMTWYKNRRDYRKAETLLRELGANNPDERSYRYNLALVLAEQEKWDEAVSLFRNIIEQHPEFTDARRSLAQALVKSGRDWQLALQVVLKIPAQEKNAGDFYLQGWVYYQLKRVDESVESLKKAVELEPDNSVYRQRYEALLRQQAHSGK